MKTLTRITLGLICLLPVVGLLAQGPPPRDGDRPPRRDDRPDRGRQQYSLAQAMSDQAQLHTIAFNGLAFLTGEFGADTFIPPGKVCDFFGFQYMRDVDVAEQGHNPAFMNRLVGNVFANLNDAQKAQFQALAAEQAPQFIELAQMRFPLIKAFCRQLNGEIPAGSDGLNKAAVEKYVGAIFAQDAEISYRRAAVTAQVYRSLTPAQQAAFAKMKFGDFSSWQDLDEEAAKQSTREHREPFYNIAYMTYLSEFFSWTAGSVDADNYFCPERHGTYFGGFYMKDMPAMGKRNYNISTSLTGDSGEAFLNALTPAQQQRLTAFPDLHRASLTKIAAVRRQISVELRKFLTGQTPDKATVVNLGRQYGELDGELSWYYTIAFAAINTTLTTDQKATLVKLRNLDGYQCAPAYLYSQPMQTAPVLPNTDSFFTAPK